ncbi:MAG TPA: PIN domain-containing protein [Blastocatellia bacterium]|nr:PIN domain-containing protein [Blastocatellia bacterium]
MNCHRAGDFIAADDTGQATRHAAFSDRASWKLALHYRESTSLFREVITDGRAVLLGVVRQEILSGIRFPEQYQRLKQHLRAFPDLPLEIDDYELAAEFFNTCTSRGVTGGAIDFLICAAAHRRKCLILTSDPDFRRFAAHVSIDLLDPREGRS